MNQHNKIKNAGQIKKTPLTICLVMAFLQVSAASNAAELTQVNDDLQKIFGRMKQKYAEHDAQQAAKAAQVAAANLVSNAANSRQTSDVNASSDNNPTSSGTAYPLTTVGQGRFMAGEELILSASLNGTELASLFAIASDGGVQLGLSDFFQIVELPIDVDLDKVSADGWYQQENNLFALAKMPDGRLKVSLGDKTYYVNPNEYSVSEDLYVDLSQIVAWFGLEYVFNEEQLALTLTGNTKLPVEARMGRTGRGDKIIASAQAGATLPLMDSGYTAFSPPMLDVQMYGQESERVFSRVDPTTGAPIELTDRQTSGSYSVLASHDLAFLNSELFLAGNNDDSLTSAWFTLSRQSEEGDLLGPLAATEYAFGDVTPVNAGVGVTLDRSLGFSVSNTPLNQLADNRRVNLVGELQSGWDVELYRNGVLIDQRLNVSEGRYEFNDTPLEYGNNDFEFIFYGPQGQIERKKESYIVDSNTVSGGEAHYRFSLVNVGKTVFDVDERAYDPTQEGALASSVVDYGVTDWLSLSAGGSIFEPRVGETQQYLNLGANLGLGRAGLLNARYQQDHNDLQTLDANYRTRVFDTSYSLSFIQREQQNLQTGVITTDDTITAEMSGHLFRGMRFPVSYKNTWQRYETDVADTRNEYFQNTIGVGGAIGHLSNSLMLHKDAYTDPNLLIPNDPTYVPVYDDSLLGSTQYRKSFGRLHTRFFSDYQLKPVKEIYTYGGVLNYSWNTQLNSELRYTQYELSDLYQVNLGLNWRRDAFYLSTAAGYNEDGSWTTGIGLRFSLGYEPLGRSVFTSGRPITQSGAVAARVFEDLNMNGVYDVDEPVMKGATVKAVQGYRESKTNDSGVAVISSLYSNTTTDIVVDESTLDGPFMIRATPGVAIRARKGFVETVDLPVVKAGELDGVIYLRDATGQSNPAPYILLNLIDKKNKVVATARSEFDGYYLFTNIKPGAYTLKVDETYIEKRGLKESQQKLSFTSKGDVIEGVDFVLKPLDEAHGYIASAGHFKTPDLMKLYYHLLRNKLGDQFIQTPFYIKKPDDQGYILGLAYFAGNPVTGRQAEMSALKACEKIAAFKLRCEVEYHDFKY